MSLDNDGGLWSSLSLSTILSKKINWITKKKWVRLSIGYLTNFKLELLGEIIFIVIQHLFRWKIAPFKLRTYELRIKTNNERDSTHKKIDKK